MQSLTETNTLIDDQLVAQSVAGDREAFATIVDRYKGLVSGMLYSRCHGNLDLSEELAQETFVIAWQKLPRLRDANRLSSWLCGIARNVAFEADRMERRVEHGHELTEFASDDQDPSQKLVSDEHQKLLWESLEALPEKYREPLVLFYRHQKNTAEVARALGLTDANVRKRLERGRAMLRDKVASLVEDLLSESSPSPIFTAAVLAMLPVISAQSAVAATGSSFALGTIGTKIAAAFAFVIGPLLGMIGGLAGAVHTYRQAQSDRERRFVAFRTISIFTLVIVFIVFQLNIEHLKDVLSRTAFGLLIAGSWIFYAVLLTLFARSYNRKHKQIRKEEGAVEHSQSQFSAWENPIAVRLSMGGGIFGGVSWMLAMGGQAEDWTSVALISIVAVGLYVWSTRTLLAGGAAVAKRVMIIMSCMLILLSGLAVNLRFNDWIAAASEQAEAAPHVPLWLMNLMMLAIAGLILGPILVTDYTESEKID